MELSDLRTFLVVADELNISRAARRVSFSQPAVSRLVRRVERSVGVQLLNRCGQTWTLSAAGADFVDRAARIVADFDGAVGHAREVASAEDPAARPISRLRVGIFFPAAAELTRPILRAYQSICPRVHVQLLDLTPLGGDSALIAGRVDVAFLWSPVTAANVTAVQLFEDRFAVLLAPHHRLANHDALDITDVAGEKYTKTMSMSLAWQAASALDPWRRRPDRAVRVDTVNDAMRAIERGSAISIGPTSLQRYAPFDGIHYVPFDTPTRPISLLCHRGDDTRPLTTQFVVTATEVAARLASLVPIPR